MKLVQYPSLNFYFYCLIVFIVVQLSNQRDFQRSSRIFTCRTTDGIPCVFPFIYDGKVYSQCVASSASHTLSWCPTEVDPVDRTIVDNKQGYCDKESMDPKCRPSSPHCNATKPAPDTYTILGPGEKRPKIERRICQFPFSYRGEQVDSCKMWNAFGDNFGRFWCPTEMGVRYLEGGAVEGSGVDLFSFCDCQDPECGCQTEYRPLPDGTLDLDERSQFPYNLYS